MKACHRCGTEIVLDRVGVRDICERCRAYLHCCRNCDFFEVGAHNDCREPNSEVVADKEEGNFCEYFRLGCAPRAKPAGPSDARSRLESLFRRK